MPSDGPLPPGARVIAYLRDSGHADQERSVGQQRRAAEAYCEQHHRVLLRAFADGARPGGSVVGRDAFQQMIDYLRRLAPEPERGPRDPVGIPLGARGTGGTGGTGTSKLSTRPFPP